MLCWSVMIHYVKGDATDPKTPGTKILAHVCNDLGLWGKGFVMSVSARYPQCKDDYLSWPYGYNQGEVIFTKISEEFYIAHMIAQRGIKSYVNPIPLLYTSLKRCLLRVANFAKGMKKPSIHMPYIGCGLAGGSWEFVEPIVDEACMSLPVYVYKP